MFFFFVFFFPLLSGVVALSSAFSLPPFIISITEKVREVWGEGRSVTTGLAVCWLMSVFAWSEACTSHIHSRKCTQELFAGLNVNLRQLVMFWTRSHTSGTATHTHTHTHAAVATHLHDKGLVNYLRGLIWSIQESCIRLQGQSEPLDSIRPSLFMRTTEEGPGAREEGRKERGQEIGSNNKGGRVLFHAY